MIIDENRVNETAINLIKEGNSPWVMFGEDDCEEHQRIITLGFIDGVLAMADALKEALKGE